MKPITRNLLMALLLPALTQAQASATPKHPFGRQTKNMAKTYAPSPTAKTTAGEAIKRLAHYTYSTGTARLNDSANIKWSGSRTSVQHLYDGSYYIAIDDFDEYETLNHLPGGLDPGYRSRNTYNTAGKIVSNLYQNWDVTSGAWVDFTRSTYTYSGTTETNVTEKWNKGTGSWENLYRETNDTTTSTKEEIIEEWEAGAWSKKSQFLSYYTGSTMTETVTKEWDPGSSSWQNKEHELYTYAGSDLTEYLFQEWDPGTGAWANQYRSQAKYALGPGLITEYTTDKWNESTLSWDKMDRRRNTYTGGKLSEYLDESWDNSAAAWKGWNKVLLSYSGGELTRKDVKAWKDISMSWEDNYRFDYNYNSAGSLTRELLSQIPTAGGTLEKNTENFYYYEEVTRIPDNNSNLRDAHLYPNPASTQAYSYLDYTIATAAPVTIIISDITGKELQRINETGSIGDHSIQIPVTALANGVYFVQLISEGQLVQNLKLVR